MLRTADIPNFIRHGCQIHALWWHCLLMPLDTLSFRTFHGSMFISEIHHASQLLTTASFSLKSTFFAPRHLEFAGNRTLDLCSNVVPVRSASPRRAMATSNRA